MILAEEEKFSEESFIPSDQQLVLANDNLWVVQIKEYQIGYHNTLCHLQK